MKTAYCFDLDGTVTSEEILPLISKELGMYDEISTLTSITMQGLLPFQKSFKLRVRLLDSIPISKVQDIVKKVRFQQSIIEFIKAHNDQCFIITGNLDVWVSDLIKQIGCNYFSSIADADGDKLLGIKRIIDKGEVVQQLRKDFDFIVAVGDGMNDSAMLEMADRKIAYGGVHEPVETLIRQADYVTYSQGGLCNLLNTLL